MRKLCENLKICSPSASRSTVPSASQEASRSPISEILSSTSTNMTLEDMAPTRPHAGGNDARHVRPRVEGEVAAGRVNVTIDDQRAEADADDEYTTFTDLGYQGEYEGVERVSATIELDGAAVGRAELVLVHRERVQHFLMACDAESQDLVSAGFRI